MPLNDTYPYSVTFIAAPKAATGGLRAVTPIGTGFIVGWPHPTYPLAYSHYLVTAAHVVANQAETYVRFRVKGGLEDFRVIDWIPHPSPTADVAAARIKIPDHVIAMHIGAEDFVGSSLSSSSPPWNPTLGDRVYFIGLLAYIKGMVERNVPMVRSGTLGAVYQDDVPMKTDPVTTKYLHAHLIDCRSYGGFSGSPCFVQGESELQSSAPGRLGLRTPSRLLGLLSGHFDMWESAKTNDSSLRVESAVNSGVGVVAPAEQILEVLMSDEIAGDRAEAEEAYAKRQEDESAATADSRSGETEFERFEDLASKIVSIPKSEIDEKRKK